MIVGVEVGKDKWVSTISNTIKSNDSSRFMMYHVLLRNKECKVCSSERNDTGRTRVFLINIKDYLDITCYEWNAQC